MTTTIHANDTCVATGPKSRHWIAAVFSAVGKVMRHRREAKQLLEMDDRKLADIGLSRSDVLHALNSSPLHDPTRELSRLAGRSL